jgi:colanic acid/amylovoran biosynthesis glycosyltransferase
MRILQIVGFPPSISETFVVNQIEGLIRRGHDVSVYAAYGGQPMEAAMATRRQSLARWLFASPLARDPVERLTNGCVLFNRALRHDAAQAVRLLNVLRYGWDAISLKLLHRAAPLLGSNRFDVIHCQFGTLAHIALALRREGVIEGPVVVNFRGHDISSILKEKGERIYDNVFRDADFFVTNCKFFHDKLLRLGCDPERLEIVYSGVDTERVRYRRPPPARDRLRLVAIGRLVEKKGLVYAIAAADLLRTAGLEFNLRIVGSGPLEAELRQRIAALGLTDRIVMEGSLDNERVLDVLVDSDIMVSPNVTAANGDEDAPVNTIKEAMAVGVPVVGSRHGGIPELVRHGETGLLADERNASAVAAHVLTLANDPDLRLRLSLAARALIERDFTLEPQIDRLVTVYSLAGIGVGLRAARVLDPILGARARDA